MTLPDLLSSFGAQYAEGRCATQVHAYRPSPSCSTGAGQGPAAAHWRGRRVRVVIRTITEGAPPMPSFRVLRQAGSLGGGGVVGVGRSSRAAIRIDVGVRHSIAGAVVPLQRPADRRHGAPDGQDDVRRQRSGRGAPDEAAATVARWCHRKKSLKRPGDSSV